MTTHKDRPPGPARRAVRVALGLWLALAVTVFQVVFGGQTKSAASQFSQAQLEAYQRGQHLVTIAVGFRPQMRAAAVRAGLWAGGVALLGGSAVAWAARAPSGRG